MTVGRTIAFASAFLLGGVLGAQPSAAFDVVVICGIEYPPKYEFPYEVVAGDDTEGWVATVQPTNIGYFSDEYKTTNEAKQTVWHYHVAGIASGRCLSDIFTPG